MSGRRLGVLVLALLFARPASALVSRTTETFDETLDRVTWRLGTNDTIAPNGGESGSYLRNPQLDAAVPGPAYVGPIPSPYFGNYRAQHVVSMGLDVIIYRASIGVDNRRPISLVLTSDMGTPDDPSDDCDAYTIGNKNVPRPGTGWRSFDFTVPSQEASLPSGWIIRGSCGGLTGDDAWNAVITNVTRVAFPFSDPDTFWYFQIWDLGIDNVRIQAVTLRLP